MVSVTSALHFITSASRYHTRYQSRFSMNIRGLIPKNPAELAKAVPIELMHCIIEEKQLNQIYNYDGTSKMAHESHIVREKDKHQAPTSR